MSLIPPSAQCPQSQCYEVVNVCWADASGNVSGCHTVPANAIAGNNLTMSSQDVMIVVGCLWGVITVAAVMRYIGKSLIN